MRSVSKILTRQTRRLTRREQTLPFPVDSSDDDDAVEPSGVYHRARPMQSLTTFVNSTEENYLHFCTEVANYQRAVTREFADGVTARESRACKREQEAIARRKPAIVNDPRTGGLIGLRRFRATAVARRATADFTDGPVPRTRAPVEQ
jgi:hypothetical protein